MFDKKNYIKKIIKQILLYTMVENTTHDIAEEKPKKIISFRFKIYIFILLFILFGKEILVILGIYSNLVKLIKYLWTVHWMFRINPFDILYFIVGPSIIWYIKPQDSIYKRYSLVFFAFVLSIIIYVEAVEYSRFLVWFEYHQCADPLINVPFEEKK